MVAMVMMAPPGLFTFIWAMVGSEKEDQSHQKKDAAFIFLGSRGYREDAPRVYGYKRPGVSEKNRNAICCMRGVYWGAGRKANHFVIDRKTK